MTNDRSKTINICLNISRVCDHYKIINSIKNKYFIYKLLRSCDCFECPAQQNQLTTDLNDLQKHALLFIFLILNLEIIYFFFLLKSNLENERLVQNIHMKPYGLQNDGNREKSQV